MYEKEHRLRSMMKMHGLSDATYWAIMCSWYVVLHLMFVALLLIFGSIVNLKFFRLNSYAVQVRSSVVDSADVLVSSPQKSFIFIIELISYRIKVSRTKYMFRFEEYITGALLHD